MEMILAKIEADPNSGSCMNVSYQDVAPGLAPSANMEVKDEKRLARPDLDDKP